MKWLLDAFSLDWLIIIRSTYELVGWPISSRLYVLNKFAIYNASPKMAAIIGAQKVTDRCS